MTNKTIGKYGEEIAKDFLSKKGYKILEENFRYSKMGEIDIIAHKDNILHFVEVKTRTQDFFGSPLEAITKNKLMSIYKCALYYLKKTNIHYKRYQIDAIGIILAENKAHDIKFIENISLN